MVSTADVEHIEATSGPQQRSLLVDARIPERFLGDVEPLDARAGLIPGAIDLLNGLNIAPDGLYRSIEKLKEVHLPLLQASDPVMYCGSGIAARHNLLMLHLLGHDSGRLYAASRRSRGVTRAD